MNGGFSVRAAFTFGALPQNAIMERREVVAADRRTRTWLDDSRVLAPKGMLPAIADALAMTPPSGEDAVFDRVAGAALGEFAEHGIRRTSMEDVARRAGVSRMTVFRRFESKHGLVEVVIAREVRRGMEELDLLWEGAETLEDRLVEGFAFAGRYVRDHPLFNGILRREPEVLLPSLTIDGGPVLGLYRSLIAKRLQAEVDAGRAETSDVDGVAEVIARLAISLLLTRDGDITLDDPDSVVRLVRLVLLPMLLPGSRQANCH
jgi:AcrR family transcriptional regulator